MDVVGRKDKLGTLDFSFTYEWIEFPSKEQQLSFTKYSTVGFEGAWPSTPTIYKWEGYLANQKILGCLIGEAANLQSRLRQYKSGTQKHGNKKWRDDFLSKGDICLYTACISKLVVSGEEITDIAEALKSKAIRLTIESLLVKEAKNLKETLEVQMELEEGDSISFWLVNKND